MFGTVVRLVKERGFGFVRQENGDMEWFFHRSGCPIGLYPMLKEGEKVEFEEEVSDKGPRVTNVRRRTA